jgi:hypothetical protein
MVVEKKVVRNEWLKYSSPKKLFILQSDSTKKYLYRTSSILYALLDSNFTTTMLYYKVCHAISYAML